MFRSRSIGNPNIRRACVAAITTLLACAFTAPASAISIVSQGPDTDIILGLPYASLEFNNPLTGSETVDGCPVLEWRDAGFTCVVTPNYEDWVVSHPCVNCPASPGCVTGYSNEIWLRNASHSASTGTTVPSTTVSIHLHGDDNDGLAEILVDGIQAAVLDMYTPGVDNALVIVRNLPNAPHVIDVRALGVGQGFGPDVAIMGAAALACQDTFFWKGGDIKPMYDFDQKQDLWGDVCPDSLFGAFTYTWCGPVALANSICWYADSLNSSLVPDSLRDGQGNVDAVRLIEAIAGTADGGTPGCDGVSCSELQGMAQNWIDCFAASQFEVHTVPADNYGAICDELKRSQDVIILLGFYGPDGQGNLVRTGGHFVTLAGCGDFGSLALSDPYWDSHAVGATPGRFNGPNGDPRGPAPDPMAHNDPKNYSHDLFPIPAPNGGCLNVGGYDVELQDPFDGQNKGPITSWEPVFPGTYIECVFAISPVDTTWFWKGGETKPMYDFDQKQDLWGQDCPNPGDPFAYTWCGPVALANSICWYDEHVFPGLVPPFLKNAVGETDPVLLIEYLATLGDPPLGITCKGIAYDRLAAKAWQYIDMFKPGALWVHSVLPTDPDTICAELRQTEDVILLLGFYQSDGVSVFRTGGHYVTVAGCGTVGGQTAFAVSDPYWDSNAIGMTPGRFNGPHGDPRLPPSDPINHNDPANYSHDLFAAMVFPGDPTDCVVLEGYTESELDGPFNGQNPGPPLPCPLPPGSWTVIDWVISISPLPDPGTTGVKPLAEPVDYLAHNYPNPFNPYTTIEYSIREPGRVTLRIYNVAGQLVRTLVDEVKPSGVRHTAVWDGRSDAGVSVSTGVYFYQLVTKDFKQTKKMVLLK